MLSQQPFDSRTQLNAHNKEEGHFTCRACKPVRAFEDQQSLDQHRQVHLRSLFPCPLPGCHARCTSNANVLLHIIAKPHKSMTRVQFDSYILNSGLRRYVVGGSKLRRDNDGTYHRKTPIPVSDSVDLDDLRQGDQYVCHCTAEFPTRAAVQAHLRSPVHDVPIYRCKGKPGHGGCGNWFSTPAALFQHIGNNCRRPDAGELQEQLAQVLDRFAPSIISYIYLLNIA